MSSERPRPSGRTVPRRLPVVGPRLRVLLWLVLGLFGLLAVNGLYLGGTTLAEWITGEVLQDYLYQVMFLVHLLLGLAILLPVVVFGALHLRNAWSRPNRRAVRAGLALYSAALVLLLSGVVLTRFDFFEIRDPRVREVAYWLHVVTPVLVAWLFVLHRLAGHRIHWRVGVAWGAVAVAFSVAMLLVRAPDAGLESLDADSYTGDAFKPSLARTDHGELIPARALMMDDYCQACHADIHEQWSHSAHRMSSFTNPAYLFSVRETRDVIYRRDGDTRASRFCAACHDLVPLFSGAFDDPDFDDQSHPTAGAGITCTACHAITAINSPRGNGDYTITEPVQYPFAYSGNPFLRWVNRQLVKAKPEFHKKTFLKPLHRTPEFCGVCHKVHLPKAINHYKWLRGQDHYDAYLLSGVSGHGAMSFYYPDQAVSKCAVCHMPLTPSEDFGARDFDASGDLKIHDHLFQGANTALAHLLDQPEAVIEQHQKFLKGALRVDIFGLKAEGEITGELLAPLGPATPRLVPGERYLLEAVVRTVGVGHLFTQGTSDSNQVWVDVKVTQGDRVLGRSGGMGPDGELDPWSHFINGYVLDRKGERIDRRNAQDIFTTLYNHQIPPGAADVIHYAFQAPEDTRGPVTIRVAVKYRKFDTRYMRYFQGDDFHGNDLPVTVLAERSITLPVAGGPAVEVPDPGIPRWQRWNDYGIALLRKGGLGELRQAEAAFRRVEDLGRADGPLNLARAYLREGRLDEAALALERAVNHKQPAYPWVAAWLSAQVNKQNGYLDEAIDDLERIAGTDFAGARARGFDFSRDFRVLNELGQTLVERAKQARGEARREERRSLLDRAKGWFEQVLELDPENVTAHYNLALLFDLEGDPEQAAEHRALHARYRPDDNARDRVAALHRRDHPAANHAAEAVVIYDLQRPGAYGLRAPARLAAATAVSPDLPESTEP